MIISLILFVLSIGAYVFETGASSSIMILCAFIVSCFGVFGLLRRRQFLSALFIIIYLLMYFPNPFLVGLGVFPIDTPNTKLYAITNVMLIFGLMLFFLGVSITKPNTAFPYNVRIYFEKSAITLVLSLLFLLAGCAIILLILFLGSSAFHATRAEFAEGQYGYRIRLISLYMFFPFLVAGPLLITQLSKPSQTVPWIISAVILILQFILYRARTPFITVMASIIIGIMLKNRVLFVYGQATTKFFRKFREYLSIGILTLCLIVGGFVMTWLRGYIGLGRINLGYGYMQVWINQTFDGGDLGYQKIQRAAYILYPSPNPYLLGQSYYRILFIPIPRSIVANKPENTSRVFCSAIDPALYQIGGTISPGVVGDLYINFGYLGVIGMFFYGLIVGRERFSKLWQWLMLGGSMTWMVHFVRGEFTNSLVTMSVYLIITLVIERILHPDYEAEETGLMEEDYIESEDSAY